MKTYLKTILLSSIISLSITVQAAELVTQTTKTNTSSSGMMRHQGMMSSDGPMNMRPKMQEMTALMQEIVNEDNLEKREVLMAEHMKKMQENMRSMHKFMPMDKDIGEDINREMPMNERMKKMEGRVDMMQILMDQMMTHSAQQEMRPKQQHKVN